MQTADNKELLVGENYLVLSIDYDSGEVTNQTECLYVGDREHDNTQLIESIPPGASGAMIPAHETRYIFRTVQGDISEEFELDTSNVRNRVIKDSSSLETITVVRLKS